MPARTPALAGADEQRRDASGCGTDQSLTGGDSSAAALAACPSGAFIVQAAGRVLLEVSCRSPSLSSVRRPGTALSVRCTKKAPFSRYDPPLTTGMAKARPVVSQPRPAPVPPRSVGTECAGPRPSPAPGPYRRWSAAPARSRARPTRGTHAIRTQGKRPRQPQVPDHVLLAAAASHAARLPPTPTGSSVRAPFGDRQGPIRANPVQSSGLYECRLQLVSRPSHRKIAVARPEPVPRCPRRPGRSGLPGRCGVSSPMATVGSLTRVSRDISQNACRDFVSRSWPISWVPHRWRRDNTPAARRGRRAAPIPSIRCKAAQARIRLHQAVGRDTAKAPSQLVTGLMSGYREPTGATGPYRTTVRCRGGGRGGSPQEC